VNMDRAIFELNASVEATSLYILICALMDQGEPPSLNSARERWNGTTESLHAAAAELLRLGVLEVVPPFTPDKHLHISASTNWCPSRQSVS